MYESAENRGLSFNDVIKQLQTDHGINAKVGADKIVFSKTAIAPSEAEMNPSDMLRQAQEIMAQMDPEELRRIQEMVMDMSPEQKEEMMKKGKDLGLL